MNRKKYLFIDGELNGGGAERVLLDILRNFDYEHNEATLLQVTGGGTLIDEVPKEVKIVEAWHGYPLGYRLAFRCSLWLGWQWPLRAGLMKVLGDKHYDVAVSFLEGMPLKIHALITSVADRNYSWVHCDLDTQRYEVGQFRGREEVAAYNAMDSVICVAKETAKAFCRRFPDCTSQTRVIYNPIDIDKVQRMTACGLDLGKASDVFAVAVCGRLTEPKRLDRVVRLAHRLKEEGFKIRYRLIGDGELRTELVRMAEELSVTDIIDFIGFQRNPYPYIKTSDLLLSTSGYEGFSLVICEAMALGVPVVSTRTAGPMEILDGNKYGLLCDHDDESIYRAVRQMFDDEALRETYSDAGRERVKDFSVERTMTEVYTL